jgi:DNA ligase-associated metallophosphoesterase
VSDEGERQGARGQPSARPVASRAATIEVAGRRFLADRSGALYCGDSATLIVSDLHLEKGSAFAARGWMLPPYDTRETLTRLVDVLDHYRPQTVIALGDSLHDQGAIDRIDAADRGRIAHLTAGRRWIWITGNHDPGIPSDLSGEVFPEWRLGDIGLRHEPMPGDVAGEIAGHLHPAARLSSQGVSLRRPCFATDGARLILPAFGAFTGGLNVLDAACVSLFQPGRLRVVMLGEAAAYPVPFAMLTAD